VITKQKYTELIKAEAKRLGFFSCGISEAEFLEEEVPLPENYLKIGIHGDMKYMENHFENRLDLKNMEKISGCVLEII